MAESEIPGQCPPGTIGETERLGGAGQIRADHQEFVATDAGHAVLRADRVGQALRGRDQQAVADLVAERIVDVLEPVEVDEDRGHVTRPPPLVRQCMSECRKDLASVGESRERVVGGTVAQVRSSAPRGS